jgi:hypothetical protein
MFNDNRFAWQQVLQEALMEVNPERLREKVAEAEAAVFQRLQSLAQLPDSAEERNALHDAADSLLSLKREVLKYPDWNSDNHA